MPVEILVIHKSPSIGMVCDWACSPWLQMELDVQRAAKDKGGSSRKLGGKKEQRLLRRGSGGQGALKEWRNVARQRYMLDLPLAY